LYDEAGNVTTVNAWGNTPPVAQNSTVTTSEDTPVSATLSATDADNNPLTFTIVTNGTLGSAVVTNPATEPRGQQANSGQVTQPPAQLFI
ncbi:MAG: Ig-like domain-containing protein, partial [Thermodesulfobacteriota bacterium]